MAAAVPKIQVIDSQTGEPQSAASPLPRASDGADDGKLPRPSSAGRSSASGKSSPTKPSAPSKFPTLQSNGPNAANGTPDKQAQTSASIDPLSQHILTRTSTPNSSSQKLRTALDNGELQSQYFPGSTESDPKYPAGTVHSEAFGPLTKEKDKKKGVSFLSRFIGGSKKKGGPDGGPDDVSEAGDIRPEGMNAPLFSQDIDNIAYNPRHPQPPGYIKVRAKYKKERDFDRLFLAQELTGGNATTQRRGSVQAAPGASGVRTGVNPIWALEFSKDGKYLAAGGQDKIVRVWAVISTPEERRAHEREEEESTSTHLSAPVFNKKAFREYQGHTSTILDLSWSKNNFLLSSSMDKTVRLWHISRPECLCTFKHTDFVPSIQFHPKDDRFFLAGSLDSRLRLWSIPDKSIAFWSQLPDMITAVCFTPDGKTAIAGTLSGLCQFYETEGLKYQTQIHVRSNRGRNTKGSKITGIQSFVVPPESTNGDVKVLISSNDSRVRLYNFRDKGLEIKFKGHENNYSQIRGSASDDFKYVICGSEDRKAYIFSTSPEEGDKRNQPGMEMFEANNSITTAAIMAPTKTRQLLSNSEDPVYDICNPPPVTLISRAESITSSRHNTEGESAQPTPAESTFKRAEESPAYLARCVHSDGNIIVTADYTGRIKVFRQDCAFQKRKSDAWETSSLISRRVNSIKSNRPLSIGTRGSGRSRRDSTGTQPPSDRILSWRQDIMTSSGSYDNLTMRTSMRNKNRSSSPRKSLGALSLSSSKLRNETSSSRLQNEACATNDTLASADTQAVSQAASQAESNHSGPQNSSQNATSKSDSDRKSSERKRSKKPEPEEPNPLWVQNSQSYAFYNPSLYPPQAGHKDGSELSPSLTADLPQLKQKGSIVSALSSEVSSEEAADEELSKKASAKNAELKCKKCGGTNFRARFLDFGSSHRLVCSRCGMEASDS